MERLESLNDDRGVKRVKRLRRSYNYFEFTQHCLYCGEQCKMERNINNPIRWKPAYLRRTTFDENIKKSYKDLLLEKCDTRGDDWAKGVRLKLEGPIDLHAAEARYHKYCFSRLSNTET